MTNELLVQIKFMMDGYAHQILSNQLAMMDMMVAEYRGDAQRILHQRMEQTSTLLQHIEGRQHAAQVHQDQL
jgi:hypothetical protein